MGLRFLCVILFLTLAILGFIFNNFRMEPNLVQKIELLETDKIIPYEKNPRTHSEEQINQILKSIKEFGFNNPILIDEKNRIIAGHGRLEAAKKLGLRVVPTIQLSHLSENQRRAFIIADNKIALNSGWNFDLLKIELSDLKLENFDLSVTGFFDKELEGIFSDGFSKETGNFKEEWEGMPEFDKKDEKPFRSLIVHFDKQVDVDNFFKLIKQSFSNKTKYIWFPKQIIKTTKDKIYAES